VKNYTCRKFIWLFLLVFCSSCAHSAIVRGYKGPEKLPAEIAQKYSYENTPVEYISTVVKEEKNYIIRRIEISAIKSPDAGYDNSISQDKIVMDYYDIRGASKTPVIIVLPILGGNNDVAKFFSAYFSRKGCAALIVHRDQKQKEKVDADTLEPSLKQMVIDHKRAIDWIKTQKDLDFDNIGVFGVSMGGIKSALLTALDQRIKASVIALAGGDLPYILLHSDEKGIVKKIAEIKNKTGLNDDTLYKILKQKIETDPINFAKYIDARKVLMVLAVWDTTVPYKKGRELADAIGGPEEIDLLAGHFTSIVYIYYIRAASLDFFNKKFGR